MTPSGAVSMITVISRVAAEARPNACAAQLADGVRHQQRGYHRCAKGEPAKRWSARSSMAVRLAGRCSALPWGLHCVEFALSFLLQVGLEQRAERGGGSGSPP